MTKTKTNSNTNTITNTNPNTIATPALNIFSRETQQWFTQKIGSPTAVQQQGWSAILSGAHTLISAPTGAGKTLCAFLVFIDRLKELAKCGKLENNLHVIYVSPLKSLGNDIRENLKKPLSEIEGINFQITTAVRTGDTEVSERAKINKTPPHVLITTPESLYLMLTGKSSRQVLSTAKAVIIDELHAVINTKRGAHLMLSLSRLDNLCGYKLQRIGLSATVKPLDTAAAYLSPEETKIIAPKTHKKIEIEVRSAIDDMRILPEGSIWPEIAKKVYDECLNVRSTIVFVEGRLQAEKISYLVNELGGPAFSRTHHGCVSKEQRLEAEKALKNGSLRLMCATSSMELGIDVGEIDLVLQIGVPRTVTQTMQRLGRAGHSPGRTSIMHIYPKTVHESIYCGITTQLALSGEIESVCVPEKCLDVLAQHLVSMACASSYTENEALQIANAAYNFKNVTADDIRALLGMLAGDYEHRLDNPVRPRLLYDRINQTVTGDTYSRMLACSNVGTIPDRGYYGVKLEDGTRLGELEEEFVFEARIGDKFLLGSYAWRIAEIGRDSVIVTPTTPEGATPPFWRGDSVSRSFETGIRIGQKLGELNDAYFNEKLFSALSRGKLDANIAANAMDLIIRQINQTGILPDDETVIIEHFNGEAGERQMVVHSVFGKRVNLALSILAAGLAKLETGADISSYDDDDGFLLTVFGSENELPQGLIQKIEIETARQKIAQILPQTPLFNMAFRYNAATALMMGAGRGKRQPLWVQRLRSMAVLDNAVSFESHPLIEETKRECLNDYLDLDSLEKVLTDIKNGKIKIHEVFLAAASPMSLPLRRQIEAEMVYNYAPTTSKIKAAAGGNLAGSGSQNEFENSTTVKPLPAALEKAATHLKKPENENMLHSVLMAEGDLRVSETEADKKWFLILEQNGRALYIAPGLWICEEQRESYENAFENADFGERLNITRRLLRYRGEQNAETLSKRYDWEINDCEEILSSLAQNQKAVLYNGFYYHEDVFSRAVRETLTIRRAEVKSYPAENYAQLLCRNIKTGAEPKTALKNAIRQLINLKYDIKCWENSLLPLRVKNYRQSLLDDYLKEGEVFWKIEDNLLSFHFYEETDWDAEFVPQCALDENEEEIIKTLQKRGASFINSFAGKNLTKSPADILLGLAAKGIVHADSFAPARQILTGTDKAADKYAAKRRVGDKVAAAVSGRWDLVRQTIELPTEKLFEREFENRIILCRETIQGALWQDALNVLRNMEYTDRARRGYFIKGLSGAQFVSAKDYADIIYKLETPFDGIIWICATDPNQPWGKILKNENTPFMCIDSNVVALYRGKAVALFSKSGKALTVFDYRVLPEALKAFAAMYEAKRIFPNLSKISVKEYSAGDEKFLEDAGFSRQMLDYCIYRKLY
ncbi:MAG: DEAD/DEAH box helicase [Clostridiales bacterium]|jgi:ATP-dependent Lhr-like helicase|nr:DEAD/DEAH box helicase [Clostridiales bacterium]